MDFISDYKVDFDIILMDIDMPHMNGLDTARRLRQVDEGVALIFITNLAQYAINGYEVRALDFIVKPVEYRELEYKLNRALLYCRRHGEDALTLESAGVARRVPLRTIYYVEVYNHSIILFHINTSFALNQTLYGIGTFGRILRLGTSLFKFLYFVLQSAYQSIQPFYFLIFFY